MQQPAQRQPAGEGRWQAPAAAGPVRARLRLPGSKSITNRALILAAAARRPTVIANPLRAWDPHLMDEALRARGTSIEDSAPGWAVRPGPMDHGAQVDVGNAGTVLRFVPPVAPLAAGDVAHSLNDPADLAVRPVWPLIGALRALGAGIDDGGRGAVPFTVHGTGQLERRPGHPGRVGLLSAGVGAPARGQPVRQGRGGQATRAPRSRLRRTSR